MGPGAGAAGGRIVTAGGIEKVLAAKGVTAEWLRGERQIRRPLTRRQARSWMTVRGAAENNLKQIDVRVPLGLLVGVCGLSGSGKSTLMLDTIGRALAPKKQTTSVAYEPVEPGAHRAIEGAPARAIMVDQVKAGIVNPASFLGLMAPLRRIYAGSADALTLGIDERQLGRGCSACKGRGQVKIDMGLLPAIFSSCEVCRGTGLLPEARDIRFEGVSLPELYSFRLDEMHARFADEPALARPLAAACAVGLGYLVLHQPAHALSGGEAQRLKIARELGRKARPDTLYILDEPSVGQHLEDIARLSGVLDQLVEQGQTVVVVEHHPHLLAACDWLIEMGPGGGPDGGHIVATGSPEKIAAGETATAPYLRALLEDV